VKCLVIGSVWPEPNSSAAGENMMNLLRGACQCQWQVSFVSAAQQGEHGEDLSALGIDSHAISLNCSSFDDFVMSHKPDIVIFDRFMTEEQFGWRVEKSAPHALRVLNTEDLHGLREQSRQKTGYEDTDSEGYSAPFNDVMLRELASILRSDLTLIISQTELRWLVESVGIPESQLVYFPLVLPEPSAQPKVFESTKHMSFIGNFRHLPNWHAVLNLHRLWPQIRKRLPGVECHIFGAYPPKKATALTSVKKGFLVKGWVDDADSAFASYRLALAPLTFGAGIKGKLLRAVSSYTPSVITSTAINGICEEKQWPGTVTRNDNEFIDAVIKLYENRIDWENSQALVEPLLQSLREDNQHHGEFYTQCEALKKDLNTFRAKHLLSRVATYHTLKSHQYMSQWIEAKNRVIEG
jgi:glycosyltransferase involved in cell wall biosynthesis